MAFLATWEQLWHLQHNIIIFTNFYVLKQYDIQFFQRKKNQFCGEIFLILFLIALSILYWDKLFLKNIFANIRIVSIKKIPSTIS